MKKKIELWNNLDMCIICRKEYVGDGVVKDGELDCSGCESLWEIPSEALRGVKRLNCSGCENLEKLGDEELEELEELKCAGCVSLDSLPKMINLRYLDCSWCGELDGLPEGLSRLESLWCDGVGLEVLGEVLCGLESLEYMRCEHSGFVGIESKSLRELYCGYSECLERLNCPSLESLGCEGCVRLEWLGDVRELKVLGCDNRVGFLGSLGSLGSLRELYCKNVDLEEVCVGECRGECRGEVGVFGLLEVLDCVGGRLSMGGGLFDSLRELRLSGVEVVGGVIEGKGLERVCMSECEGVLEVRSGKSGGVLYVARPDYLGEPYSGRENLGLGERGGLEGWEVVCWGLGDVGKMWRCFGGLEVLRRWQKRVRRVVALRKWLSRDDLSGWLWGLGGPFGRVYGRWLGGLEIG